MGHLSDYSTRKEKKVVSSTYRIFIFGPLLRLNGLDCKSLDILCMFSVIKGNYALVWHCYCTSPWNIEGKRPVLLEDKVDSVIWVMGDQKLCNFPLEMLCWSFVNQHERGVVQNDQESCNHQPGLKNADCLEKKYYYDIEGRRQKKNSRFLLDKNLFLLYPVGVRKEKLKNLKPFVSHCIII